MRPMVRSAGVALLLMFLLCVFLFCLFTLALIFVAAALLLVQVAMGYRPDRLDPLVTFVALMTTVLCLGAMCVNAYRGLRYVVGEIR